MTQQPPDKKCRDCGGGSADLVEHEQTCVMRGDHWAYATDRRNGRDRRAVVPSLAATDVVQVVARAVDLGGQGLCILDGPCVFCGYKGAGYWQIGTHGKDCPFHAVGGDSSRADHIVAMSKQAALSPQAPQILGVDEGRPGGDYTGYACSCGAVRVETEGPCKRADCPIPATLSHIAAQEPK